MEWQQTTVIIGYTADGGTRENQQYKQFFPFSHRFITDIKCYIRVITDLAPYPIAL